MSRTRNRESCMMSRTVWIVDGAYLWNFGKGRPAGVDYLKLKKELETANGEPIYEAYYLNSTQDPATDAQNAFHTWLKCAAPRGPKMRVQLYRLKDMHAKCSSCGHEFERQVQKGVDVGIATLIVKLASQGMYDRLILTAGDGDFEDAISYVKSELHKEFWLNGGQNSLSADLQSYADDVLWLDDMVPAIDK
ncbi:NYN domain-containing protein [Trinickia acidisoli]|uniref:NYN domain-containing protein n=1 Tax=Trinickia acidisoli TaxID=2767482 RepID=UPI001F5DCCA0|nr:NYN domain-containing protein [Trinickia acidisoli]